MVTIPGAAKGIEGPAEFLGARRINMEIPKWGEME